MMGDIALSDGVINRALLFFVRLEEQVILRIYDVRIIKCNDTFGAGSRRRQVCGFFVFSKLFCARLYPFT